MFAGFAELGTSFAGLVVTRGGDEAPTAPDAAPTYRVYGPDGPMPGGTGTASALAGAGPGLWRYEVAVAGGDGYELGQAYRVLVDYRVSGVALADQQTFLVT